MPVISVLWDSGSALAFESLEVLTSGVCKTFITGAAAPVIASATDSFCGFLVYT